MVDVEGARSVLAVPLFRDGLPIGAIVLYRREVAPFSEDDLSLVQAFAAQAVIAIENVRQFREVQERLERERASAEILDVISRSRDDDRPVFQSIVKQAAKLVGSDATALVLGQTGDAALTLGAHVGAPEDGVQKFERGEVLFDPEQSLVARAIQSGEVVHLPDMKKTSDYKSGGGVTRGMVDRSGVRSALFVPLMASDQGVGALALFRKTMSPFTDDQIALVETFAAQAVIAIENVRQFKALETLNAELGERVDEQVGEIERMGRLKRFLPAAVADAVVTSGDESMLTSHRALVATLFCDMRGFTAFCEAAEPEETIEVLQTYHQEMSDLIDEYGGGVDQRAGDGIMVIFNDPIPVDDPAGDAVRLAIAMRAKMKELCAGWKRLGHRLGFGVGVSLGYATVGMVGSAGRFDYTASGTAVNTAARLCDMAADGEILISPRVWIAVEGDIQAESRGEVGMKGIREPVEVFAVV